MEGTELLQTEISSIDDAARVFGSNDVVRGKRQIHMVLIPSSRGCSPWISIPEGMHSIITSFKKFLKMGVPGIMRASPFTKVGYLVSQQFVVYDTPVKECPTKDNVMVQIDVAIVFRIADNVDCRSFVYNLGPKQLDGILKAYQEEAVRKMAREKNYDQIYDLMDAAARQDDAFNPLANCVRSLNEKLNEYNIEVRNMMITQVLLPHNVARDMEEETTFIAFDEHARVQQRYNKLLVQNADIKQKQTQRNQENLKQISSNAERSKAIEETRFKQVVADTKRSIANIEEEQRKDVKKICTDSETRVVQIQTKSKIIRINAESEAVATANGILNEAQAYRTKALAIARRQVAENRAKCTIMKAKAEKDAAIKLQAKRDFDQKMGRLRVLKALAENDKLVISGNNGDNAIAQLLAAKNASVALGLNK